MTKYETFSTITWSLRTNVREVPIATLIYNKLSCTVEKRVGPYLFVQLTSSKIINLLTENPNL